MRVRVNSVYRFHPVNIDRWDAKTDLLAGEQVRVVNLNGAPKCNTMNHCHVKRLDGSFAGLVCCNSLLTEQEFLKLYCNCDTCGKSVERGTLVVDTEGASYCRGCWAHEGNREGVKLSGNQTVQVRRPPPRDPELAGEIAEEEEAEAKHRGLDS